MNPPGRGMIRMAPLARLGRQIPAALGQPFGPVFFYDVLRTARRGRYVLHRFLYASLLLFVLFFTYASWFPGRAWDTIFEPIRLPVHDLPRFAESIFTAFVWVQSLVVFLVTPAYAAGALCEERDRRTLEYLLTTDLSDREIVLGKLAARVVHLFLLILAGLPILSIIQVLGGVDPNLLLAVFAGTGISVISLTGLTLWVSLLNRTALATIASTYFYTLFGLALTSCGACIPVMNFGNPFAVLIQLQGAVGSGIYLTVALALEMTVFTLCHAVFVQICSVQAISRLRLPPPTGTVAVIPSEAARPSTDATVASREPGGRAPDLGERPVLWKELLQSRRAAGTELTTVAGVILPNYLVFPALVLLSYYIALCGLIVSGVLAPAAVNGHVRVVGTGIGFLLLLVVALSAASRVSRERDQRTLDSLLTTTLPRGQIILEKAAASFGSLRSVWWAAVPIWVLGLLGGGLQPAAVILVAFSWAVYAAFAACLGLWYSTVSRTTGRAMLGTILTLLAIAFAPPLLMEFAHGVAPYLRNSDAVVRLVGRLVVALDPPAALWIAAFPPAGVLRDAEAGTEEAVALLFGLAVYAAAAFSLWRATCRSLGESRA